MEPKTVLIVDDDAKATEVISRLLTAAGWRAIVAHGGSEALRAAWTQRPDAIILDVCMPDLSGHDVCRALRSVEQTRGIPIMMLTGLSEIDDQLEGLGAGVDTYAVKPIDPRELQERVERLLRSGDRGRRVLS